MRVKDCVGCRHCERRVWSSSYKPANYHEVGVSHADLTRSMTDEELADALFYGQFMTKQDTLDWLQQEAR